MANERARALRKRMTPQEVRLWLHLRELRRSGHHFRRQSPVGPFVVDFECWRARLVIEVDGGQHCDSQADVARDRALADMGYRVLRFWNSEIDRQLEGVFEVIIAALDAPNSIPHPDCRRPSDLPKSR